VVEDVLVAGHAGRTAEDAQPLPEAERRHPVQIGPVELHVVGGEEVQPPIAVVVEEGGRDRDTLSAAHPRPRGDVAERPVAVVPVEPVALEDSGHVKVDETVVVVVAGGYAAAPVAALQPGAGGRVLEAARALVAVEAGCRGPLSPLAWRSSVDPLAMNRSRSPSPS
jgi:hypothetical protein